MTEPRESWWRRRVLAPILAQLKQGITPQQIAFTIAAGFVLGIFPILGSTTLLCALLGVALRLNQPVIQLVNYLAYPVQIALLFPFYRAGEWLFGLTPVPLLSITELAQRFADDVPQFFVDYGLVALCGVAVWLLVAPLLLGLLYFSLRPPMQALANGLRRSRPA
jgi:uncharacterized protein (DUF2062 family)